MCSELNITMITLLKCFQNIKLTYLFFLEVKLDNVVPVFLHVLLCQPHSPREYRTSVRQGRLHLTRSFIPQKSIKPSKQVLHVYMHKLIIRSLNMFALLPKLLQGIRRQHSQVAYHSTLPCQPECDIHKNCSIASHSISKCII